MSIKNLALSNYIQTVLNTLKKIYLKKMAVILFTFTKLKQTTRYVTELYR